MCDNVRQTQGNAFVGARLPPLRRECAVRVKACRARKASVFRTSNALSQRSVRRVSCSIALGDQTAVIEARPELESAELTASVEEPVKNEFLEVLMFCVPVFGSMVADPLMGLIDTACVGKVSTIGLAALGPAMNVYLFLANVFGFLGTSTAALIAPNQLHPDDSPQERVAKNAQARGAALAGTSLSVVFGVLLSSILLLRTRAVLGLFGATGEVLAPAAKYTAIRAYGITGMLLSFVFHGASMAQGDPRTPMIAFSLAGLCNLVMDIVTIFKLNMGVAGAALATTGSIYFGLVLMGISLFRRAIRARQRSHSAMISNDVPANENHDLIDHERLSLRSILGHVVSFAKVGSALLLRQVASMLTYSMLTFLAAKSGTLSLATHQVSLQLFWFLTFFSETLSVCGQTLVGSARDMPDRLSRLTAAVLKLAGWVAVVAMGLTFVAHIGTPFLFTSDSLVKAGMMKLTGLAAVAQMLSAYVVSFDGLAIGTGDIGFLPVINAVSLALSAAASFAMGKFTSLGVVGVWVGLLVAYVARFALHLGRIFFIKRKFGHWPINVEQARKRADQRAPAVDLSSLAAA